MARNKGKIESVTPDEGVKRVVLRDAQIPHVRDLKISLELHGVGLDRSDQGTGKSFCAMGLAQEMVAATKGVGEPSMLIVCGANAVHQWGRYTRENGVVALIYSYGTIRIANPKKCPYISVSTEGAGRGKKVYCVTEKFRELVMSGVMLVIDEFHNVEMNSLQARAVQTLTCELGLIRRKSTPCPNSYIMLLSNTPLSVDKHIASLLRLEGIITHDKLYDGRKKLSLGFAELCKYCKQCDAAKTTKIIQYRRMTAKSVLEMSLKLYVDILRDRITSGAVRDFPDVIRDCKVMQMDQSEILEIAQQCGMREEAEIAIRDGTFLQRTNMIKLSPVMKAIERRKTIEYSKDAKKVLEEDPDEKVVIFAWYLDNIALAKEILSEYSPVVCSGALPMKKRPELFRRWNENSNEIRVMIAQPDVGGEAIELDDKHGGHRRNVYLSVNYRKRNLQIPGRFMRVNTKSIPIVHTYFLEGFQEEQNLFRSSQGKEKMNTIVKGSENGEMMFGSIDINGETKKHWT